jgi:hypothetical protein
MHWQPSLKTVLAMPLNYLYIPMAVCLSVAPFVPKLIAMLGNSRLKKDWNGHWRILFQIRSIGSEWAMVNRE